MLPSPSATTSRRRKRLTLAALASVIALGSMVGIASAKTKDTSYRFVFTNGVVVDGSSTDKTVELSEAGGTSVVDPAGMRVHLSCSDKFADGWGKKDGPHPVNDKAWQIASFGIERGKKTCGDLDPATGLPWPTDVANKGKASKSIEFRFEFENGEVIS